MREFRFIDKKQPVNTINLMKLNKKTLFITGAILLLSVIVLGFFIFNNNKKIQIDIIDSSHVIPYLQDGDIVLRFGDGALSSTFRNLSLVDKRFSHLGIIRLREGNASVIHSIGHIRNRKRGVEETALNKFLNDAKSIGIFRVQTVEGRYISDKAVEYIGHPFDWSFDLSEDEYIYCTELLYVVLKHFGYENILATHYHESIEKEVILLDSVSLSPYIDEIFYIGIDGNVKTRWYNNILFAIAKAFASTR
jgi:hypothetical protein